MCYITYKFSYKEFATRRDLAFIRTCYTKIPKAYAAHFLQRGCCAHPHMLDYEGGKHTGPYTYTGATAYAVHFFQRGCYTQPQMLDYEGGKQIAHTQLVQQPMLYFSFSEATQHTIGF